MAQRKSTKKVGGKRGQELWSGGWVPEKRTYLKREIFKSKAGEKGCAWWLKEETDPRHYSHDDRNEKIDVKIKCVKNISWGGGKSDRGRGRGGGWRGEREFVWGVVPS